MEKTKTFDSEKWQVVPIEPTVRMREVLKDHVVVSFLGTKHAYKAMLAAAPKPQGETK